MIKTSLLLLLIAHLFGDFYFQPRCMVNGKKEKKIVSHVIHSLIYFLCVLILSLPFERWWISLIVSLSVSVLHFGVDYLKAVLNKRFTNRAAVLVIFFSDQFIHVLSLVIASQFLISINAPGEAVFGFVSAYLGFDFPIDAILIVIFSLLFLAQPANVLNRFILDTLFKEEEKQVKSDEKRVDANTGVIIGYLERLTMYCFCVFLNWYAIIPVILTAKTFARFKRFDNSDLFAEKYIIGTLLSTFYVSVCLALGLLVH